MREWVEGTIPRDYTLYRFKWLFRDERASAGGRGSARVAAPDSMRFDVTGPFGSRTGSAVVVGDSAVWADPSNAIEELVPNYPLLWALFGVARLPGEGAVLRGHGDAKFTAWQYAEASDTVDYVHTVGSPAKLVAEVRQGGKVVGRAETTLTPDGKPVASRLMMPSVPARLDVTFTSSAQTSAFAPEIWLPRQP